MNHFEFRMIPAGEWRRVGQDVIEAEDLVPRPHLVPITEKGKALIATTLAPSQIRDGEGWIRAWRFSGSASEEQLKPYLAKLNRCAEKGEWDSERH